MRVFMTGATGFVGSPLARELLDHGHTVVGLARSGESAKRLEEMGVQVHRGDLHDFASLKLGATCVDGVIHLAFLNTFSHRPDTQGTDLKATQTLGEALVGTNKPFIVASGPGAVKVVPGKYVHETDPPHLESLAPLRAESDLAALALAQRGVRSMVARIPIVIHGPEDKAFLPRRIALFRKCGIAWYVGDGSNRLPAVHVRDCARLLRLALEKAPAGSILHPVAEEAVTANELIPAIAKGLGLDTVSLGLEEAIERYGSAGPLAKIDMPMSNKLTKELTGWEPHEPGVLADLVKENYFEL
jgi:nucleoside-diphosphate-sugar epimerase